jgi:hypothetical protein
MTETELKLIAAPASIGLRTVPKKGYSRPAAMGMPKCIIDECEEEVSDGYSASSLG